MAQAKCKTHVFFSAAIANAESAVIQPLGTKKTFIAHGVTSAGVGAANVKIWVSNDGTNFMLRDTLALTLGTTRTYDYLELDAPWKHVKAEITDISGTNAAVSCEMGTNE